MSAYRWYIIFIASVRTSKQRQPSAEVRTSDTDNGGVPTEGWGNGFLIKDRPSGVFGKPFPTPPKKRYDQL